ncbi:MAG: serine hydrolase [Bacteroidota bacterium]|nr:serine hydrolase [Bacteroidota bacterium]
MHYRLFIAMLVIAMLNGCASTSVAYRLIHYGDSDINDFKKFPARHISAEHPRKFVPGTLTSDVKRYTSSSAFNQTLEKINTLAFVVIHNDSLVYENYFEGYTPTDNIQMFSINKSFVSLLTGVAIHDRYLASVNDTIVKYLPELKGRGFGNITLLELLQMTAPIHYAENSNPFGVHAGLYYTSHMEKMLLKLRANESGKRRFVYRSGDIALLGLIFKRVLYPKTLSGYMQEKIWGPLGMESPAEWTVDNDSLGFEKTWCCLASTARDIAKVGQLYLQKGSWNGRQIVPAEWIKASLAPMEDTSLKFAYNYNWWLYPQRKFFAAIGKDGQFIYVMPDKKLVIVRMGKNMGHLSREQWFSLFNQISAQF